FHGRSRSLDRATELMSQDDRDVHRPRMRVVRLMNVRPAHGNRPDAQQHIGVADLRHRDVTQLDRERLERILDDGGLNHDIADFGLRIADWRLWIAEQISVSTSRSPAAAAALNSSASMTSGAPITT